MPTITPKTSWWGPDLEYFWRWIAVKKNVDVQAKSLFWVKERALSLQMAWRRWSSRMPDASILSIWHCAILIPVIFCHVCLLHLAPNSVLQQSARTKSNEQDFCRSIICMVTCRKAHIMFHSSPLLTQIPVRQDYRSTDLENPENPPLSRTTRFFHFGPQPPTG